MSKHKSLMMAGFVAFGTAVLVAPLSNAVAQEGRASAGSGNPASQVPGVSARVKPNTTHRASGGPRSGSNSLAAPGGGPKRVNCNSSSNPGVNYTCKCEIEIDGSAATGCLKDASDCKDIGDGYYTCDSDHSGEEG